MYSKAYDKTLAAVALSLGMERDWLFNVISLESGWSPSAYNSSGAVGLIQLMPQTLRGLGLLSTQLTALVPTSGAVPENVKQLVRHEYLSKYPDAESQLLGPVYAHFKGYRPYPTAQSVYMAVFYPRYRNVSPMTTFPDSVRAQNPGITTVADYVAKVENQGGVFAALTKKSGIGTIALAAVGLTAYLMTRS